MNPVKPLLMDLFNAQDRGTLFDWAWCKKYMPEWSLGKMRKTEDIELNVCKTKKLTNTRSSSADEALKLTPPKIMSLEQCLDFIDTDELLEVTPESLRIRKKILDPTLRRELLLKTNDKNTLKREGVVALSVQAVWQVNILAHPPGLS